MLKEQANLLRRLSLVSDLSMLCLSLPLAYLLRQGMEPNLSALVDYLWILLPAIPLWFLLLTKYGFYDSLRRESLLGILSRLVQIHFIGGALLASLIYFVSRDEYSRGLFLVFIGLSFVLISVLRGSARILLGKFRKRGFNSRNILIVGAREKALRFSMLVEEHADWGLCVIGLLQVSPSPLQVEVHGYPVLGRAGDLVRICKENPVDEVVFCLHKDQFMDAEEYIPDLEEMGITVRMVLDFIEFPKSRTELSFFHGEIPIMTFHTKSLDAQQLMLKRLLDVLGAMAGLGIMLLVFPFVAIAIRIDSPGPIFFGQMRLGENGRNFRCWKFRTMIFDAEMRKSQLEEQNEIKGAMFKMRNDPRITRSGRFLRRSSLDELPQFWNVLRGEMSLVGTRPPTPDEVGLYENWHRRRISIKPGITGMWQVNGRNAIDDFDEIVRLDLRYIDTWNLWLDIRILLKTIFVVFMRRGSC